MVSAIEREGIKGYEKQMSGVLDNYFRYLYRILKYIDDSKLISDSTKYQYAGILRAHLSYMELLLIYYNGLSVYGREKMKPLIEKYHLLKNIRAEKLNDHTLNARIKHMSNNEMYKESAWSTDDDTKMEKKNSIEQFCFRLSYAFILALVFNTLLSDWWHHHVNILWEGMTEVVVRGLILIAVVASMVYYQARDKVYRLYFVQSRGKSKLWQRTWNKLKENLTLPIFLFLIITSVYTTMHHHVVWYDSHTIYLDLSFFYFPLIADVLAIIVNVTREANQGTKK